MARIKRDPEESPKKFGTIEEAAGYLFSLFSAELRVAAPLGLGKPNGLLNLLYERAVQDSQFRLSIHTALSLNPPGGKGLAKRFLDPFVLRQWGKDFPRLRYAEDAQRDRLPSNVQVHEFYVHAGKALGSLSLQRHYQSINYTHVAANLAREGVQAVVQIVAKDPVSGRYSLSCNPDLTLDFLDRSDAVMVGVVHKNLPFLTGEAEVGEDFFDVIVEDPLSSHELFALPKTSVDEVDHCIGFYASQLVLDEGTLQIGIGSLSDALVASLLLRHTQNETWKKVRHTFLQGRSDNIEMADSRFEKGLFGLSEMVMDGFMHLRKAGILKRCVEDGVYLQGAFFLGSKEFYEWLRNLEGEDYSGLRMGRVSKVNDLYDPDETLQRTQRKNARFFNTCMQVTLLGGAASETLEDGRVVSGVGGQYNFVAQSHELEGSRSILMLRSTRESSRGRTSNIVWSHGHLTIPRHLRDVVITEYGIANIRGKSDEATIQELLNITDSEFQEDLLKVAKRNRKISSGYQIPEWARNNTPKKVHSLIQVGRAEKIFAPFPFGSDLTPEEERLSFALENLKGMRKPLILRGILVGLFTSPRGFEKELARIGLENPRSLSEIMNRSLLLAALKCDRREG